MTWRSGRAPSCCAKRPPPRSSGRRRAFRGRLRSGAVPGSTRPAASTVASNGDVYFADSNNHVIRRINRARQHHRHGRRQQLRSARASRATSDPATEPGSTPGRVAVAPDAISSVADSHNNRISPRGLAAGMIMTIAGSGATSTTATISPRPRRRSTPSAVGRRAQRRHLHRRHAQLPRADESTTPTGFIHTIAGDGPRATTSRWRRRTAVSAHLNMPSDIEIAPSGDNVHRRHAPSARAKGSTRRRR